MNRQRTAAALLAAVALSAFAGWFGAATIRSPAEIAAGTAAPSASPILVPAESRVLSTDIVTRGTARFGSPQRLSVATSAHKPGAGVVGELPALGAELSEGDVALTASARPVFLLVGRQPAFRDLAPGDEGRDVLQLEAALVRLGFDPGEPDGVYDEGTEEAVTAWYWSEGFAPFTATEEQRGAIRMLEAELASAQLDVLATLDAELVADAALRAASATQAEGAATARGALGALNDAVQHAGDRADAANAIAAAEVAVREAALRAVTAGGRGSAATPVDVTAAQAELSIAIANAEVTRLAGEQAITDAMAGGTVEQIAAAQALAAAANAATAAEIAAKRLVVNAVQSGSPGVPATPEEIALALAELNTAHANAEAIRLAGEQAVAEAAVGIRASLAAARPSSEPVRAAETLLGNAGSAVAVQNGRVARLAAEVELARRRAGVQVPADEVIFISAAPVRVVERVVARGARAEQVVLAVADATVLVDGSLPLAEARLVSAGMRVQVDEPELGLAAEAVVRRVAEAPGTDGVDGFHVYFEIVVDGAPPALVGASVRLTVPIESSAGSVLAVPVSAVSLAADGSSRVQRAAGEALEFVTVEPGLSADGFVGIEPVDGRLEPGDLVVVGFETVPAAGAPSAATR